MHVDILDLVHVKLIWVHALQAPQPEYRGLSASCYDFVSFSLTWDPRGEKFQTPPLLHFLSDPNITINKVVTWEYKVINVLAILQKNKIFMAVENFLLTQDHM